MNRPAHPRYRAVDPSPEHLALVDALRALQDDVTAAAPPPEVAAEVADLLGAASARLRGWAVPEREQVTGRGRANGVLGRSQAFVPRVHLDTWDGTVAEGTVTFGRHHLGGNGAAHGGALPLLFDDLLGRLVNARGRPVSRTAYLHVEYRSITPIDRPLRVAARIDRHEGRKWWVSGALHDGDVLCAEAAALFVVLRPDQP